MWILCIVWKMIFPSIRRSFQRLHKVHLNGILYHINIFYWTEEKICHFSWYSRNSRKGVHESNVCDTSVYRFPNFHIFKQFPFQIPYNLDHFFQFSITFNNSFLPFQFPYPSIFATCFPFPPNRANSPFYPSVHSSSPTYFTSTFISNSADGLVYPSILSGERPQWFPVVIR